NDAAFDAMFFKNYGVNPFVDTDEDHLSTFAVDVDTGSYTLCRSYLNRGALPEPDAVRVEEFVNYFDYWYKPPAEDAFAIHNAVAPSKFGRNKLLMRVGLQGRVIDASERKDAVLTFVIDISGSMARENRLGLVKSALRMLVDELRGADEVGIAVYGSSGREVLSHRSLDERGQIINAIDQLESRGSTNAEEGLVIGYKMARRAFRKGAINRVILCSDGVANVGRTGPDSILKQIKKHAGEGITLSAVGFGMGNYNDVLMEQLGDKGNGHYAYVDTLAEAKRVFVENLTGTLQVIARDVKVQVDFSTETVRSYRLIGYENRDVADEDFRDDRVDGGEVGSGHSVTALYELKLWPDKTGRLATIYVRHKHPETGETAEVKRDIGTGDAAASFDNADPSLRLAACAAEFAEILRHSYWAREGRLDDVLALAKKCESNFDRRDDVKEFTTLVAKAKQLGGDKWSKAHRGAEPEEKSKSNAAD
ncbi:MAG: vWA domain-containing protein, partial [Planctomycetota bacterium]